MKFIVDAQLPRALSEFLKQMGHDSVHTLDLPNKNKTSDQEIISIANVEERIVLTKDADFIESYFVKGEPRKLIVVKTGNITNKDLMNLFSKAFDTIITMITRSNLIELSKKDIAEHD